MYIVGINFFLVFGGYGRHMVELTKSCHRPTVLASGLRVTFLESPSLGLSNHVLLGGIVNRSVFLNIQRMKFKNQRPSSKIKDQVHIVVLMFRR